MPIPQLKYQRSWKQSPSNQQKSIQRANIEKSNFNNPKKRGFFKKFKISQILPYAFILAGVGTLSVLAMFAWYSRDLPRPDKIIDRSVAQSTKIYDRTGEVLLFEVHGTERRTIIPLEEIPEYVKWSTILVEDKNFYQHSGFDARGIARAIVKDVLTLSKAQGGSTLTQQLVKNALLSNEKAFSRKIKEVTLAYQIERKFSKDQILQLYFNEIPYGSSAYGIESASQFYFEKSAKDLTIGEGAALAALPKAPTYYSPYGLRRDQLIARKNFIVNLLEEEGIITPEEAQEARETELVFAERKNLLSKAPHFVIMVREQLLRMYGEREVEQGGLKIITTLDWDTQQAADEAVAFYAETNEEKYKATNTSLVAIDPKTGQILAMVGSRDYFNTENQGNFNVALQGKRQPGSSFKPFVYAVGFEKGYTDKTTLWDVVTKFGAGADGKEYEPKNYTLKELGPVSIRTALAGSLNIPAVKMLYLVGPENVIKTAQKAGYTTFQDPGRYGLALVLGGAEVTLLEHTTAYAAFANEGEYIPWSSILKIESPDGKTIFEHEEPKPNKVFDKETINLLTDILSDNEARTPFFGASNFLTLGSRPVAAKTGTTNDYRDAWTIGYTPSMVVGVWVGNNNFTAMTRGADGSVVAAPIWNRFLKNALEGKEIEQFEKPNIEYPDKPILRGDLASGIPVKIDRASGLLATDFTPESFIEEKVFKTGHNILHYVKPSDPIGAEPKENERDQMYSRWEEAVQRWREENDWKAEEGQIPTEYDNLHVFENKPSISIISPTEGQTINGDIIFFTVEANAPRGISRVEFYVDDKLVSESRIAPYSGRYIPDPSETNGYKTLKAIAYDDIDNSESVFVSFNLFLQKNNLEARWQSPKQGDSFSKNQFPIEIKLAIPSGIEKAEIFATPKENPSQYILIKTINFPQETIEALWQSAPEKSGEWEIYSTLYKNQIQYRTNGVSVWVNL